MDTDSKQVFGIKFGNEIYRHKFVMLMKKNYVILCLLSIQPEHTQFKYRQIQGQKLVAHT
jgi:hypothetical protein